MEWKSLIKVFAIAGGIVIAMWACLGGLSEVWAGGEKNIESITALFSGLAFAGMIVAIVLQGQELFQTREQLRRTAEANEKAAKLARENIKSQEMIAQNNIAAQRLLAILDYYYKSVESSRTIRTKEFNDVRLDIEKILDKFLELKGPNGPVITDTTLIFTQKSSTPEA